jgi:hypothetical protein
MSDDYYYAADECLDDCRDEESVDGYGYTAQERKALFRAMEEEAEEALYNTASCAATWDPVTGTLVRTFIPDPDCMGTAESQGQPVQGDAAQQADGLGNAANPATGPPTREPSTPDGHPPAFVPAAGSPTPQP